MISADVKANKNKEIKGLASDCILQIFIRSIYLQKLKHNVKHFCQYSIHLNIACPLGTGG